MKNINATLFDHARTSIFIAHRLRTVVEAGEVSRPFLCFGTYGTRFSNQI